MQFSSIDATVKSRRREHLVLSSANKYHQVSERPTIAITGPFGWVNVASVVLFCIVVPNIKSNGLVREFCLAIYLKGVAVGVTLNWELLGRSDW